jgi:Circadian oscillating protein COP23
VIRDGTSITQGEIPQPLGRLKNSKSGCFILRPLAAGLLINEIAQKLSTLDAKHHTIKILPRNILLDNIFLLMYSSNVYLFIISKLYYLARPFSMRNLALFAFTVLFSLICFPYKATAYDGEIYCAEYQNQPMTILERSEYEKIVLVNWEKVGIRRNGGTSLDTCLSTSERLNTIKQSGSVGFLAPAQTYRGDRVVCSFSQHPVSSMEFCSENNIVMYVSSSSNPEYFVEVIGGYMEGLIIDRNNHNSKIMYKPSNSSFSSIDFYAASTFLPSLDRTIQEELKKR